MNVGLIWRVTATFALRFGDWGLGNLEGTRFSFSQNFAGSLRNVRVLRVKLVKLRAREIKTRWLRKLVREDTSLGRTERY